MMVYHKHGAECVLPIGANSVFNDEIGGRKKKKTSLRLIRISIEIALVEGIHMSLMAFDNRHNPLYKNKNVIDSVTSIWNAISVS